jgi:hypothetical protein
MTPPIIPFLLRQFAVMAVNRALCRRLASNDFDNIVAFVGAEIVTDYRERCFGLFNHSSTPAPTLNSA